MKILFDTNVLVAAFIEAHAHHRRVWPWFEGVLEGRMAGCLSLHTLAEAYSVLTVLPTKPRISPDSARELLETNGALFEHVALSTQDYHAAITRMAALKLPGGGIYDALHAQAALKAKVEVLTLNPGHFQRLGEDVAALVRTP